MFYVLERCMYIILAKSRFKVVSISVSPIEVHESSNKQFKDSDFKDIVLETE